MKKFEQLGKRITKQQQQKIYGGVYGGGGVNVWCNVVCCDGTDFQYSGPAVDCLQGQNNACNLCSSHDGVDFFHCTCNPQ